MYRYIVEPIRDIGVQRSEYDSWESGCSGGNEIAGVQRQTGGRPPYGTATPVGLPATTFVRLGTCRLLAGDVVAATECQGSEGYVNIEDLQLYIYTSTTLLMTQCSFIGSQRMESWRWSRRWSLRGLGPERELVGEV